jgi:hypothetical protein
MNSQKKLEDLNAIYFTLLRFVHKPEITFTHI